KKYNLENTCTVLVLQDVVDPYNVGAIFRTANAFAVNEILLVGKTPIPPNEQISKNSMGLERSTLWSHHHDFEEVIKNLRSEAFRIVGLELINDSIDINEISFEPKTAFVLGNERVGIYKKNIKQCDVCVHIQMFGKGSSLNVSVAAAIALHARISKLRI
ncbi:TrmH family RNA methyltransferase, partial [Candidatus Dojkabacteria bacterium]